MVTVTVSQNSASRPACATGVHPLVESTGKSVPPILTTAWFCPMRSTVLPVSVIVLAWSATQINPGLTSVTAGRGATASAPMEVAVLSLGLVTCTSYTPVGIIPSEPSASVSWSLTRNAIFDWLSQLSNDALVWPGSLAYFTLAPVFGSPPRVVF